MAFGGGSKPAKMLPNPKVVQTSHAGPKLTIAKPSAKGTGRPMPGKSGCCGNK